MTEIGRISFYRLHNLRHLKLEGFARILIAEASRRYPGARDITVMRADWESAYIITARGDLTAAGDDGASLGAPLLRLDVRPSEV